MVLSKITRSWFFVSIDIEVIPMEKTYLQIGRSLCKYI